MLKLCFDREPDGYLREHPYWLMEIGRKHIERNRQIRKSFSSPLISKIGRSIRDGGQINPIQLNYKTISGRLTIIAGETRWRAFNRFRLSRGIKTMVFRDLPHLDLFKIQADENLHEAIPPDQEAGAIAELWAECQATSELRREIPTRRAFCEFIGKSENVVRRAIRFTEGLAPVLRKEVNDGTLSYILATELARLGSEQDQIDALQRTRDYAMTPKRALITVRNKASESKGQTTILGSPEEVSEFEEAQFPVVLDQAINRSLDSALVHFTHLRAGIELGRIKPEDIKTDTRQRIIRTLKLVDLFEMLDTKTRARLEKAFKLGLSFEDIFRKAGLID